MEGNCSSNGDPKGKAKVPSDVQEQVPFPDSGTCVFEEENRSEDKVPDEEAIVEGSSTDAQEFMLQDQPSLVALPDRGGDHVAESAAVNISSPPRVGAEDALVSQVDDGSADERSRTRKAYSCRFCAEQFYSGQALGGHQKSHKMEREFVKKQKLHGYLPFNYSSVGRIPASYPDYGRVPYGFPLGPPPLPVCTANNFNLPRPLAGYPYSMPGFPNIQNPRSTTGLTLGQFGLPSSMLFNSGQLPVYDRPMMINPNTGNNGNDNRTSSNFNSLGILGGGEGGMLEGFRAPNGNSNSMGPGFNSLGIVGSGESGSTARGLQMLTGNSHVSADGFESAGTSSGVVGNFIGLSLGESIVSVEVQNTIEECDESDGTRDLLSRLLGTGSVIDGESNGGGSNEETEVNDGTRDLVSRYWVTGHMNGEHNGDGSSTSLN